ncbi:MAG TPA: GntR family transcriptional regulator [Terriglobia bacterium]|nr:GntR family transcriptional regulator [Terriglobia bacterium]
MVTEGGAIAAGVIGAIFDKAQFDAKAIMPLYLRLQHMIREAVTSGILHELEALPGEREMAEMLGISRVTVRKALADLVSEGVLVQRRGSGTFVSQQRGRIEQPLSRLTSFTQDMRSRGLSAESQWLERSIALPTPQEAMVLGLSPGAEVCRLHRLRRADGVPMAIELAVVPRQFLPDPEIVGASLYAALDELGARPIRALQRLHAISLPEYEAGLLQVPVGSATLFIERVSYLPDGRTVEFTQSHYRGDTYDFVAELYVMPTTQRPGQKEARED